jgi:hypothetical protein
MRKFLLSIIILLTLTSCAFAYRGSYRGWHRGIIIVRPPHCEYVAKVMWFNSYSDAIRWVEMNRDYLFEPTIHIVDGKYEVWYAQQYCN